MDKKWYMCNPEKNKNCKKSSCFVYGGVCELTSNEEYAALDDTGKKIEVNVRQRLMERMRKNKDQNRINAR